MDSLIGEVVDRKAIKYILKDLEIEIKNTASDGLSLLIPPFRADVQREVDVIEEILRIYGFNTVQIPSKLNTTISYSEGVDAEKVCNTISNLLSNNGFNETINNSLTKGGHTPLIPELDIDQDIELLNPLSLDLNVMRQSLLFSGLENIAYNQNRKNTDVKLYEFGRTYHKKKQGYLENQHLQILVSGRAQAENWNISYKKVDFYFIKEKVEHILKRLGIKNFESSEGNGWGRSYSLVYSYKKKRLVCFGKVTKDLCNEFDIKSDVYMADFNWDLVLELTSYTAVKYKEVSKFPEVRRDLSLLIDKSVSFDKLQKIAKQVDNQTLKSVNLFDIYEGNKLPEGKKSYALSFIMADNTKTLTDKYVDKLMERLIKSFKDKAGAELR
jgi:phenylalanyl-tRNA synthetase beta chain